MQSGSLKGDYVQLRIFSFASQNAFFFFLSLLYVSYSIYNFFFFFSSPFLH